MICHLILVRLSENLYRFVLIFFRLKNANLLFFLISDIDILKYQYILQPVNLATKRLHQLNAQTRQPRATELTINKRARDSET